MADLEKKYRSEYIRNIINGYEKINDEDCQSDSEQNSEETENCDEIVKVVDLNAINEEGEVSEDYAVTNNTKDGSLKSLPKVTDEEFDDKTEKAEQHGDDVSKPPILHEPCFELPKFNTRALSKYAKTYELEKFEKKILLIFNQEDVDGYEPRLGTDQDARALTRTFEQVGFQVVEYKDLKKREIFNVLRLFFNEDLTDLGCIAIAVLTHGNENGMLRAKDRAYNEAEISKFFETAANATLVTKPRILIVQACRGTRTNLGVPVLSPSGRTHKDLSDDAEPYTLPGEADQLILHSTYAGNPSFRNTLDGSWLVQSLCSKIDRLAATTDLESIIVEVKKEVAIDRAHEEFSRRTNAVEINKQIPVVTSTLIRKLFLRRFRETSDYNGDLIRTQMSNSSTEMQTTIDAQDTALDAPAQLAGISDLSKDYFNYLVNCLRFFITDNPEDTIAQSLLEVSETFGEGRKFNAAKEKMINALCNYFGNNEDKIKFFKYIFIKKSESTL